jgi:Zn-dependent protease with chaperone function
MLNPAWLFVNGFNRMFLRITLGASRLQEVLADRFAAITYGLQDFIAGLTHVVRQTILFNFQVDAEVQDALQAHRRLSNLYSLPPPPPGNAQSELEDKIAEQLKRSTGPYDSHLSLPDRIDLVKKAGVRPAWGEAGDLDAVWDLLPNPVAWQNEMTSIVQTNLDMQTRSNPEEQVSQ